MTAGHVDPNHHRTVNKRLILKQLPLFAGLSDTELTLIAHHARLVDVGKDEVIYAEGDPPDALYIMVTGRARIATSGGVAREETLEVVHRGDYFGVISLLTGQPHSVTVRAVNDSILLKIRQPDFERLLQQVPQLALHVSQTLSRRLSQKRRERTKTVFESTIVSVYSAVPATGKTLYAVNLAASIRKETGKQVLLVDLSRTGSEIAALLRSTATSHAVGLRGAGLDAARVHQAIVQHPLGLATLNVAHDPHLLSDVTHITPLLALLAQEFHFVVVDLPSEMDRTVFKSLVQADVIHLVTDARRDHLAATRELLLTLQRTVQRAEERVHVIVNDVRDGVSGADQQAALQSPVYTTLPFTEAPLIDDGRPIVLQRPDDLYAKAVRRVAREVGGVLVGLALGSGAALGLAHIGVLKVLEREQIPIDIIAGSSIGALIGAFWASGIPAAELEQIAMMFRKRWQTFRLFAEDIIFVPTFGFITGRRVVRLLQQHLGDKTFRDLKIPMKITAVDYALRRLVVFDEGSVVDAIRASISIPAIFVPHPVNGRWLIDGGILDPVPVDILARRGVHKIIAVNALPSPEDIQRRYSELGVEEAARAAVAAKGRWSRFWYRVRHRLLDAVEPKIADVIMHSMQAMEYILAEHGCQQADVALHPTIPKVNWYEFYNVPQLIQRGVQETEQFLPQIQQLVQP